MIKILNYKNIEKRENNLIGLIISTKLNKKRKRSKIIYTFQNSDFLIIISKMTLNILAISS